MLLVFRRAACAVMHGSPLPAFLWRPGCCFSDCSPSRLRNLYSLTKGQAAIRQPFRVTRDLTGNLPPLAGIFPDGMAPVIRTGSDGERELAMLRWGMPCPSAYGGQPVTNIRNTKSPHWRGWLGPKNRCLVPFSSFCEYADTKPRKTPTWVPGDESHPLLAFCRHLGDLARNPRQGQLLVLPPTPALVGALPSKPARAGNGSLFPMMMGLGCFFATLAGLSAGVALLTEGQA